MAGKFWYQDEPRGGRDLALSCVSQDHQKACDVFERDEAGYFREDEGDCGCLPAFGCAVFACWLYS